MQLRADDRGLAVQVGVTILLGFVVIALATYQVQVVPQQNARVEFTHSQTVQGQLQDVRGAVVSVPGGGTGRSVSVQLGTTYPERTVFLNPPAPSGQLRATPGANVTLDNATARGEIGDFWDGSARNVSTRALVYEPDYSVYQNGPTTVIENTVVYDEQPRSGEVVVDSDQDLVDGREITLVGLQGAYQEATVGTVSVDVEPVSTSTRTVTVTNESASEPVTVTVPTRLSNQTWADLLNGQRYVVGQSYQTVSGGPNLLTIELKTGVTYELQMAKVGLTNSVDRPGAAYLTDVEGDGATVAEGTNETLVVEVRDKFNNPVSGVAVNASTSGPNSSVTVLGDSDAEGRVRLAYSAPPDISGVQRTLEQVNVSFSVGATNVSGFDAGAPENVTLTVAVRNADGSGVNSGGNGAINPGSGVVLKDAILTNNQCGMGNGKANCEVNVTLENLDEDRDREITRAQFTFYNVDKKSSNTRQTPESVVFGGTNLEEKGKIRSLASPVAIPAGSQTSSILKFYKDTNGNTPFETEQGDFFVITVVFNDGQTVRYFVAPE